MSVHVRLFAGAADAVGATEIEIEAPDVDALLTELIKIGKPDTERVLGVCSFLIDGVRAGTLETAIPPNARVDVLPPFAGG